LSGILRLVVINGHSDCLISFRIDEIVARISKVVVLNFICSFMGLQFISLSKLCFRFPLKEKENTTYKNENLYYDCRPAG